MTHHRTHHPPQQGTRRPTTQGHHTEEAAMTLTELIDNQVAAIAAAETIPCQENEPEMWFADTPDGVEFAKALCGTCPAREDCLAGALERREPWGVWGGELFVAGVVLPRKRPRGRPRKNDAAA